MFGRIKTNWEKGEFQDHPMEPPHDRGVFCVDIQGNDVVTGSADHGLRVFDITNGKFRRELFTKKCGHKEWVTTCAYLADGRILSGGMDSQLCLWKKGSVVCDHIAAHDASITKVLVDQNNIGLSASYDCFINVWDLNSIDTVQQLYGPHKNAVLDMDWRNSLVVSGDKNGVVAFWDINTGRHIKQMKAHGSGIGCIRLYTDNVDQNLIISTGLKDGIVNIFDMRTNTPVFTERLHGGAINECVSDMSGNLITCSADRSCCIIDPISGFKKRGVLKCSDSALTCLSIFNLTVVGCVDGNILVFDNDTQQVLYGFGCMQQGGVRLLKVNEDMSKLVVCGDDPTSLILDFA